MSDTIAVHRCPVDWYQAPKGQWGASIDLVIEHGDGTLWAGNDEYSTQVNLCPFCGYRARVQIPQPEKNTP